MLTTLFIFALAFMAICGILSMCETELSTISSAISQIWSVARSLAPHWRPMATQAMAAVLAVLAFGAFVATLPLPLLASAFVGVLGAFGALCAVDMWATSYGESDEERWIRLANMWDWARHICERALWAFVGGRTAEELAVPVANAVTTVARLGSRSTLNHALTHDAEYCAEWLGFTYRRWQRNRWLNRAWRDLDRLMAE